MHRQISLIVIFSILLIGVSFVGNGFADRAHSFDSDFGKYGISQPGSFLSPQHLAFDSENNLYVTDLGNARIQKFDSNGNFLLEWGSKGSEPGQFGHPSGIAISDEFVFVVDNLNNDIQKFDLDGNFITHWGQYGKDSGFFNSPRDITISDENIVYVVDSGNARIQKFTLDGEYVSHFGLSGTRDANFITPVDIAITSDKIFVTDSTLNKISIFDLNGNFLRIINDSVGGFPITPHGIVFDDQNNFYISDYQNNRIIQYDESGISISVFGQMGFYNGQFKFPTDVALSNDGYLFVTDSEGHRIQKFSTPVSIQNSLIVESNLNSHPQVESPITSDEKSKVLVPNDFEKPKIMVPEDIIVEAAGKLTSVNIGNAIANDQNGILSLTNNAPSLFTIGTNMIIWTAIDGAGNMAIASQTVTVKDTTSPIISPLYEISREAKSTTENIVILEIPSVTDDVGVFSVTNDAPEVFPLGETIVTWTATDVMGNISSFSQPVYLIDSISPRIAFLDNITVEASSTNENLVELIIPEYSDDVGVFSVTNDAPEVFPLGETIVTWTATDASGNTAYSSQTISVIDTTAPIIEIFDYSIEANISNGSDTSLYLPIISEIQNVELTNDAPEVFPLGETIVTWTATDASGNTAYSSQTISVIDTTLPTITIPIDIQVEAESVFTKIIELGEIITEDFSGIASITNDAPEVFPLGETIVTWTATDNYGNLISDQQIISVIDTSSPEISGPSNLSVEASNFNENIVELSGFRTSDLVEIASVTNDAPEVFQLGETIITWTATDTSGNTASTTQTISVIDTTLPTITAPIDIQVEATSMDTNNVESGFAEASDLVEIASVTNDAPEVFQLGETIITWTATDTSGNTASTTQTISVIDTTLPTIKQPEDVIVNATSKLTNTVVLDSISVIESISDVNITNNAPLYYEFGTTIVTWTATDTSGNTASTTQTISVIDTSAPLLNIPQDIIVDAVNTTNFVEFGLASVEDIIDDSPIITNDAPEVFQLGETIITWTATDKFGNSLSVPQIVFVQACGNSPSYYNTIVGSEDDDLLTGTTLPDLIFAKGGDDIISGSKGNDCILGGEGNDIIFGNDGNDNILGQDGNDIIKGHSGDDIIFGGFGFDIIDGGEDIDICKIIDEQNTDIVIKCESNSTEN